MTGIARGRLTTLESFSLEKHAELGLAMCLRLSAIESCLAFYGISPSPMTTSVPGSAADPNVQISASGRTESASQPHILIWINVALLCLLLVATTFAYKDVLFSWFGGDDFVHLCWLAKTLTNPELVLRNFYANWLDAFGSAFYRPLVSVTLYFDYLIWGDNGLGFHITNLAFHFATAAFTFLFVQQMQLAVMKESAASSSTHTQRFDQASLYLWPFFAAGLFALHPVHPEVVSWIIGRVDSVASAFVMSCLFFYAHWRGSGSKVSLGLGLFSMVLALCSKEIGVLTAPVLTVYEFCFGPGFSQPLKTRIKTIKVLTGFWVVFLAYFVVRQLALGTWLGGYDNRLGLGMSTSQWLSQTWHGILLTLVPVNADVIKKSNSLIKIWTYCSAACGLTLLLLAAQHRFLRQILFGSVFVVLALAPVYKIFYVINAQLEASRYAYLLSVPICILLGLAVANLPIPSFGRKVVADGGRTIVGLVFLVGAFGLLRYNNIPWHVAGVTANAVLSGLKEMLGPSRPSVPSNVVLVGPPDYYKGAYICRNAVNFMMEHLKIDPKRSAGVVTILDKEKTFPMGRIRGLMEKSPESIEIWHWNAEHKRFDRVKPIVDPANDVKAWTLLQAMPGLQSIPLAFEQTMRWDGKALRVDAKNEPFVVHADFGSSSTWGLNFLAMDVIRDPVTAPSNPNGLVQPCLAIPGDKGNVYISGMPVAEGDSNATPVHSTPSASSAGVTAGDAAESEHVQTLIFPLRSVPAWTLNYTRPPHIPIIFCKGWSGKVLSFRSVPAETIMPLTSFKGFGGGGYYMLWNHDPEAEISVDVSKIPNAKSWEVEVIQTLDQFSQGNPDHPELDAKILRPKDGGTQGHYTFKLHDFPEGFYCVRAWALDDHQKIVGFGSDHYRVQFKP